MPSRPAFTLIEVVIAIFVFSIGGLGLAASAATVAKQLSATTRRSDAAAIARSRAEKALAGICDVTPDDGTAGIRSVSALSGDPVRTLDQRLERWDAFGLHRDRFISATDCE